MNKIMEWDYKEQIDFDELCEAVDGIRRVQIYYIETESDQYAILISDQLCLHKDQVQEIYKEWWNDEEREGDWWPYDE